MEKDTALASRIVKRLETIRKVEGLSVADFAAKFDISYVAYYNWLSAVKANKPLCLRLPTLEFGLKELGYDAWIIIEKKEKERR